MKKQLLLFGLILIFASPLYSCLVIQNDEKAPIVLKKWRWQQILYPGESITIGKTAIEIEKPGSPTLVVRQTYCPPNKKKVFLLASKMIPRKNGSFTQVNIKGHHIRPVAPQKKSEG